MEGDLIAEALRQEEGHRIRAAARLGITRQALWKKIRERWGEEGPPP